MHHPVARPFTRKSRSRARLPRSVGTGGGADPPADAWRGNAEVKRHTRQDQAQRPGGRWRSPWWRLRCRRTHNSITPQSPRAGGPFGRVERAEEPRHWEGGGAAIRPRVQSGADTSGPAHVAGHSGRYLGVVGQWDACFGWLSASMTLAAARTVGSAAVWSVVSSEFAAGSTRHGAARSWKDNHTGNGCARSRHRSLLDVINVLAGAVATLPSPSCSTSAWPTGPRTHPYLHGCKIRSYFPSQRQCGGHGRARVGWRLVHLA